MAWKIVADNVLLETRSAADARVFLWRISDVSRLSNLRIQTTYSEAAGSVDTLTLHNVFFIWVRVWKMMEEYEVSHFL